MRDTRRPIGGRSAEDRAGHTTHRTRRIALACTLTAATAMSSVVLAPPAGAAVPEFPDNIVVFPDRDMVSLEGFAAASGQTVTIEVRRGPTLIGSTTGTGASAAGIAAGEPTVEVNHPGGVCWGAGTALAVTPDIRAGDVITVRFGGVTADTTVQAAAVTGSLRTGTRLVVDGRIGSGVDPDQLEQRIINPAMKDDPTITRRDARAVPGPLAPAPKGSYSSGLTVTGTSFTATYDFATEEAATLAAEGALRAMAWQNEDADGNRQGLTISEFGEVGGPGMGGCPAGATGQGPKSPTAVTAVQDGPDIAVSWTAAEQNPGTSPVLGWSVRAVSVASTGGAQTEFGKRLSDRSATSVRLPGVLAGHRVEVRAVTESGESWPPALNGAATGGGTGGDPGDTTPPPVSVSPAGGTFTGPVEVRLGSADPTAQIYYTLDGSSPLDAPDTAGAAAATYVGPFTLDPATAAEVTVRFVAIDAADNASLVKTEVYRFGARTAPGAPTLGKVTAGNGSATVTWTAPADPGSSPVTGYTVTATPATGTAVTATAGPNATQVVVPGLTNGTAYSVSVTAANEVGTGAVSAAGSVTPAPPAKDTVTVTRATWKSGDLRIQGTGSQPGATVTVRSGGPTGIVVGTAVVGQPAAGAASGDWSLRVRTGRFATTRPTNVYVVSSGGGQVGPVTVANG